MQGIQHLVVNFELLFEMLNETEMAKVIRRVRNVAGPTRQCAPDSCKNGGLCEQQWDSYYCDCDLTSFTGPTCSDGE